MIKEKAQELFRQVKENLNRLRNCPRHRFAADQLVQIGTKVTCLECQGSISLTDVGLYIQGYKAAGGSADDIWPGYEAVRG